MNHEIAVLKCAVAVAVVRRRRRAHAVRPARPQVAVLILVKLLSATVSSTYMVSLRAAVADTFKCAARNISGAIRLRNSLTRRAHFSQV